MAMAQYTVKRSQATDQLGSGGGAHRFIKQHINRRIFQAKYIARTFYVGRSGTKAFE